MRNREKLVDLLATLSTHGVGDVRATYLTLRDDLAELLAELAADILLHQQTCKSHLAAMPEHALADPEVASRARDLDSPFWALVVDDFRRLAEWLPRQRLARFGEQEAIRFYYQRLLAALRPALVELQRHGILDSVPRLLSDEYWETDNLLGLAVRYEGFVRGLSEGLEHRFECDLGALR